MCRSYIVVTRTLITTIYYCVNLLIAINAADIYVGIEFKWTVLNSFDLTEVYRVENGNNVAFSVISCVV